MALLEWNERLQVHVDEIDAQHHRLVDLVNELYDARQQGQSHEVLRQILSGLVAYVSEHFASEEGYMEASAYPRADEHRAEHDELTRQVAELARAFLAGRSDIDDSVFRFLKQWLTEHIIQSDMEFARHLQACSAR